MASPELEHNLKGDFVASNHQSSAGKSTRPRPHRRQVSTPTTWEEKDPAVVPIRVQFALREAMRLGGVPPMNATRTLSVLLAFASSGVLAAPRFEDFPSPSYVGKPADVHLQGAKSRRYASILRLAFHQPVNFSGRYILSTWGCGASCVMGAAIDAKTGSVTWLPFTVCCWNLEITEPLEYRRDSRLLIVHGSLDEKGPGSRTHYYDFDGRRFAPIVDTP